MLVAARLLLSITGVALWSTGLLLSIGLLLTASTAPSTTFLPCLTLLPSRSPGRLSIAAPPATSVRTPCIAPLLRLQLIAAYFDDFAAFLAANSDDFAPYLVLANRVFGVALIAVEFHRQRSSQR